MAFEPIRQGALRQALPAPVMDQHCKATVAQFADDLEILLDRLKGHAGGFEPFLSDYGLMLDRFGAQLPRPWAVLAHSMGAGLALLALARGEDRFAAAMLTSPMIGLYAVRAWPRGLAERVARGAVRLGLAGVFLEQRYDPFNQPFEGNILTHDRARFERFAAQLRAHPDLAIGAATWGWVDYALSAGTVLMRPESASAVRLPFSVVASGQDKLVMSAFAKRFTEATPRGHYLEIAGAEHEILMEKDPIRALFWRRFDDLIAGISAPSA